jgi:hypothetical protein
MTIDFSKINNMDFDYDPSDYPDFCDACIVSCDIDGREATPEELDEINNDSQFVYESLLESLF